MSVAETMARQPMKCGVVKPMRRVRPALANSSVDVACAVADQRNNNALPLGVFR